MRHLTGFDQQQISEKLNISIADYSKIETGALKADDAVFKNMIALFNIDREHFNACPDKNARDLTEAYFV